MTSIISNTGKIRALVNQLHSLGADATQQDERKRCQTEIFKSLNSIERDASLVAGVLALNIKLSERLISPS